MTSSKKPDQSSMGRHAIKGSAFMVGTQFLVRFIGIFSVVILARLLTPADFGLYGTAALILSLFVLLREMGFNESVIKQDTITKADIDTLWTMRLIASCIAAILVFLTAPLVAGFLKEERITLLLRIMALLPVIDACASPATSLFLRELKYGSDFLLKASNKLIRVIVVIIVAYLLRSYWALIIGALLASFSNVIVTHVVRPYRPRLTLEKLNIHKGFTLWVYVRSLASYTANHADEFIVRGAVSTSLFGQYHIARDLARVLIFDVIGPLRIAMLPALSRMQNDTSRRANAISHVFGAAIIVAVPVALGIMLTADKLTLFFLGAAWTEAGPFLQYVAIGCACLAVGEVNQSNFTVIGLQRISAQFWLVRAVLVCVGGLAAAFLYGPLGVAAIVSAVGLFTLLLETRVLFHRAGVKVSFLTLCWRPLCAGAIMAISVYLLPVDNTWPLFVALMSQVLTGALVYGLTLLLLWRLSGFSKGPELTLYKNLPTRVQKIIPVPH